MEPNETPIDPTPASDSSLLEELVALTNSFNPERVWQGEEKLENMEEAEEGQAVEPQPQYGASAAASPPE